METSDPAPAPPLLERPLRWWATVPPLLQDTTLALALTVTLVVDFARTDVPPGGPIRAPDALGYVLVVLLVLPLAVRRVWPRAVFVVVLVDSVIVASLLYRPSSFGFGLIVATYTVARWCRPAVSIVAFALAEAFGVFVKIRANAAGLDVGWFAWPLDVVYFGAAWFLGHSIRTRNEYASALEQSREALARQAVRDERARIARELHDAVGHSISVMLLHAGGAEHLVERDPDRAKQALHSVGDVGRAALGEMDQLLGLLRDDEGEPDIVRPSLANLQGLVEEFRQLGLDIALDVRGEPVPVSTAVDLSAFRIVQEALTNTLKHAGPTSAEVVVEFGPSDLTLAVRDHGRRWAHHHVPKVDHDSRGIVGMRERASMLHGELEVGPCPDEGFLVSARLPMSPGSAW